MKSHSNTFVTVTAAIVVVLMGIAILKSTPILPLEFNDWVPTFVAYSPPDDTQRAAMELDLFETILRSEFASPFKADERSCFVQLGYDDQGRYIDPPASFLRRFDDLELEVHPVSEARFPRMGEWETQNTLRGIESRITGKRTNVYRVQIEEWIDSETVKVSHSFSSGPLSGGGVSGAVYHFNGRRWSLRERGSGWVG
ncbi:MAG: hypothetical protein R3B91_08045 [Planctomycetaceae bacterium]